MSTAGDLIKGALRLIGAIAAGETPSSSEQSDALTSLNEMIESWSNKGSLVYESPREEFTLVPGQGSYTIGSGGDFDTVRPIKIKEAMIEIQGSSPYDLPVKILTLEEWNRIKFKSTQNEIPSSLYLDVGFPLSTIHLHGVPNAAQKLAIHSQKVLSTFASAATTVSLPPGYNRALRYNLAVEIAPEYGREISPRVEKIAIDSLANIRRANKKNKLLSADCALVGTAALYDIYSGGT